MRPSPPARQAHLLGARAVAERAEVDPPRTSDGCAILPASSAACLVFLPCHKLMRRTSLWQDARLLSRACVAASPKRTCRRGEPDDTSPRTTHACRPAQRSLPCRPSRSTRICGWRARQTPRLSATSSVAASSILLYGGNANLYNFDLGRYADALAMMDACAAPTTHVITSVGGLRQDRRPGAAGGALSHPQRVMLLPMAFPADNDGIAEGVRRASPAGLRRDRYIKREELSRSGYARGAGRRGAVVFVKYAVERADPDDAYLDAVLSAVEARRVASGMGETPVPDHIGRRRLATFTSGAVCIAPSASLELLRLYRAGATAKPRRRSRRSSRSSNSGHASAASGAARSGGGNGHCRYRAGHADAVARSSRSTARTSVRRRRRWSPPNALAEQGRAPAFQPVTAPKRRKSRAVRAA